MTHAKALRRKGYMSNPNMTLARNHNRSNLFIASFQVEGLCTALRATTAVGGQPGPATLELLKSLRDAIVSVGSGLTVEHLPEVTNEMNSYDVLTTAEVLRTTILAFLSPEEAEEQRGVFGFHANRQAT
jgi:hypothetical protein